MPRVGPLVIFAGTFLVWIMAKGETAKYLGFATTKAAATAAAPPAPAPAPGTSGPVNSSTGQNILNGLGSVVSGLPKF